MCSPCPLLYRWQRQRDSSFPIAPPAHALFSNLRCGLPAVLSCGASWPACSSQKRRMPGDGGRRRSQSNVSHGDRIIPSCVCDLVAVI